VGPDLTERWQDIRRLWGDTLRPVPENLLPPTASPGTKAFLAAVGLPVEHPVDFAFYHDERLLQPVIVGNRRYFAFGEDSPGSPVRLATEACHDAVVVLHPDGPFMFVNSSVADFVYSYGVLAERIDRIVELPFADRGPLVAEVRALIDARDPDALDPDGLLSAWDDVLGSYEQQAG